jgi:Niemann-Pick C1 protein
LWGFFQDDIDTFDETDTDANNFTTNFLDHLKCFGNAYNFECLAPYGGPIDPVIAVGGFLRPRQTLSEQPTRRRF